MIEIWIDKHDGKGCRQMLLEPNERERAAEIVKNAVLQGWLVQCF